MPQPRYYAWTRFFTGRPISRAYVMDRTTGKVVIGCEHAHRRHYQAEACAKRLLAAFLDHRLGVKPEPEESV